MTGINPNNYLEAEDDSAMIQAAVDEAARTGAAVVIPRHNSRTDTDIWVITRAIELYSGSTIYLDNCLLKQQDGMADNIFVNRNFKNEQWKTREGRQSDIRIEGFGNAVLDGGKYNGISELSGRENGIPKVYSNSMLVFMNTERIFVSNIRLKNQRYWAMTFWYCSDCHISNIDFYATATCENQDGIDIRTGCSNFTVENITGCTGDDTVAMTCLNSVYDEPMKEISMNQSIHDIVVRNIRACTLCSLVRVLNHSGKKVYNIIIENITETNEYAHTPYGNHTPIDENTEKFRSGACVRIGENFYCKDGNYAKTEDTFNITVKNVSGHMRTGVRISRALSSSLIENIKMSGDGGTAVYFSEGEMENIVLKDIFYPLTYFPKDTDDNRLENSFNRLHNTQADPNRHLFAIYFKEANIKNFTVSNVFANKKLSGVFGGNGNVHIKANNIFENGISLVSGDGIIVE